MKPKRELQRALELIDKLLAGKVEMPRLVDDTEKCRLQAMGMILFWALHSPSTEAQLESCAEIELVLNEIEAASKGEISLEA